MSPALFVQIDNARTTNAIGPIQRRHLTAQPAAPSAIIALVSAKRMNREQFFRVVSELDEDRLRKALWNLYWRGTTTVRERIEVEFASDGRPHARRKLTGDSPIPSAE
jgi:hypothetical protein